MNLNGKQRAYLISLAMKLDATFQVGKGSITPEYCEAIDEALSKKEMIKISVLKNCDDEPKELGETLAGRTRSTLVQVIGKKIVLYRPAKDSEKRKIVIPRAQKTEDSSLE